MVPSEHGRLARTEGDEKELTSRLLHLKNVHHDSDHDDEHSRPYVDPEALPYGIRELRNDVRQGVGRESQNSVCILF